MKEPSPPPCPHESPLARDSAFSRATSELATWLQNDYKLSSSDVAAVLGTSIQYSVSEVADRNVGVVAKISKKALATLKPATTAK